MREGNGGPDAGDGAVIHESFGEADFDVYLGTCYLPLTMIQIASSHIHVSGPSISCLLILGVDLLHRDFGTE